MIRVPVSQIVTGAAKELNAIASGSPLQPELMVDGVELLNQIFDDWNADRGMVYADRFDQFTFPVNTNPVTIGPAPADWVVGQPPVSIEGIQVILTGGTPNPYVYLRKRDAAWWQAQPSPTVTTSYPTDFYYDPTWDGSSATPAGSIYFWPGPTTAYDAQVWMRMVLAQVLTATVLGLPPGYAYAMRMELASRWATPLRKIWTPGQDAKRVTALERIQSNNTTAVRIQTRDAGMPSSRGGDLPSFMWPSGLLR